MLTSNQSRSPTLNRKAHKSSRARERGEHGVAASVLPLAESAGQPAWRRRCELLYDEGVAIRSSASSRASAVREGGGEASVGVVQAGLLSRVMEQTSGVPTLSSLAEGHVAGSAIASCWGTPRGRRTWACTKLFMLRAGVSRSAWPLVMPRSFWVRGVGGRWVAGREGNASAVSPR